MAREGRGGVGLAVCSKSHLGGQKGYRGRRQHGPTPGRAGAGVWGAEQLAAGAGGSSQGSSGPSLLPLNAIHSHEPWRRQPQGHLWAVLTVHRRGFSAPEAGLKLGAACTTRKLCPSLLLPSEKPQKLRKCMEGPWPLQQHPQRVWELKPTILRGFGGTTVRRKESKKWSHSSELSPVSLRDGSSLQTSP